jgi:hypothetical protein
MSIENDLNDNAYHIRVSVVALIASFVCLGVYFQSIFFDFVNWDDPFYIIDNPGIRILDWQFVTEAFVTSYMGWWMPLTWISFAVDFRFWGLNPFGYHLNNVLLHAINTGLVVLLADGLLRGFEDSENGRGIILRNAVDGKRPHLLYSMTLLLAGLLWGLHPLRVESVAWVTERKDVLNGLFTLMSIHCYLRYVQMKSEQQNKKNAQRYYMYSLLLLLFSLMSKPVSVMVPAMLLVIDWYPLGRFRRETFSALLVEKIPFVFLVLIISCTTILLAAGNRILVPFDRLTLFKRFILAGNSLFEYCLMSFYPIDIVHIYLLPWPFPVSYALKSFGIALFSIICVWQWRKKAWLPATWITFVLPLIPILGFFQNGSQSHAARFTYIPAVLPSICAAAIISVVYRRFFEPQNRNVSISCVFFFIAPIVIYSVISFDLIASWKNSETLWSRTIALNPVGRAFYMRADYFLEKGRYPEAAEDLKKSIEIGLKAGFTETYNLNALRGSALARAGNYQEAVDEFTQAIKIMPRPNYFFHRGNALKALGDIRGAEDDFLRAGSSVGPIEWIGPK